MTPDAPLDESLLSRGEAVAHECAAPRPSFIFVSFSSPVATPSSPSVNPLRGIAWFDLDGTLLAWDCQLLFRHFVVRREPWRVVLLPVFLMFLPFAGWLGTGKMKRVFLSFLWRMSPDQLAAHSRDFADHLMSVIYPQLRDELERHRAQGDFLILASASPEFYVSEIGRRLGFDLTLGTVVEISSLFPKLVNHKGAAKVERLRNVQPTAFLENGKLRNSHGYSDSSADLPMLELCDRATVVNPSPSLTAKAEQAGWRILRPPRPWRGKIDFSLRVLALLIGLGRDPAGIKDSPGKNPSSPRDRHRV